MTIVIKRLTSFDASVRAPASRRRCPSFLASLFKSRTDSHTAPSLEGSSRIAYAQKMITRAILKKQHEQQTCASSYVMLATE